MKKNLIETANEILINEEISDLAQIRLLVSDIDLSAKEADTDDKALKDILKILQKTQKAVEKISRPVRTAFNNRNS